MKRCCFQQQAHLTGFFVYYCIVFLCFENRGGAKETSKGDLTEALNCVSNHVGINISSFSIF